ncbi:MAG: CotH kinase family protein, partial [Fluviicola sp.]|nr:CotH kinase family protein [Fluviicola sp.]
SAINFLYHYPSETNIMPQQAAYIQTYVDSFETAVNGPNFTDPALGYRNFTEPQTFIDFLIVNEISKNVDGYRLSTYLHKEKDSKGGKLRMGPVWDFNLAWWNADYCEGNTTTDWAYEFNDVCGSDPWTIPNWWDKMMQDPWFQDELKCRWTTLRQGMLSEDSLFHFIDSVATYIDDAKDRHFELWPILGIYTWPNPSPLPIDYAGEITALKTWIQLRTQWLDANIPGTCHLGLDEISSISHCSVVPNPFESQFELKFFAASPSKGNLFLEDLNGRIIHSTEVDIHYGDNSMMMEPTTALPDGVYFVRIVAGSNTQVVKVLKH